ncbi:hypothetical protein [Thioclava sp. IC9]|uniref:hypothetical protein n=1 Tax=Thioclava sp. IC9 TaxID=1973007 RepID=UPI000B54449C|nr:hypothetical protein [Thioclava sp. IC9]OWY03016.1 hypothetical protein B6V76_09085 [Thioclava sp. IC9]
MKTFMTFIVTALLAAGSAHAAERAQFYIPDKPAKLVYLFTCEGESQDEISQNWEKAKAIFASDHQAEAARLETETKAQRESGHAPSQAAIDAHNVEYNTHKAAVEADLAPLGCTMNGLMHMP